jgi:hypothetical protein
MPTLPHAVVALITLAVLTPAAADARSTSRDCGASVLAVQAEVDTACPCAAATDHEQHVRCVTKKLRELSACVPGPDGKRSCGPLPHVCAARLRQTATRSACGKPSETVACCVPRQRDCVGDQTPGDGKQDGTCAGTKRKCDRVTECLVPKCQLAANAERCTALGGTVGTGRDCATACEP